jgi:hypothetical protein
MSRLIAALVALSVLAVPAAAQAKTLRGKTSQGRGVTLTLDAAGVPKTLNYNWTLSCRKSKAKGPVKSSFVRPFDQATADVINDTDRRSRRFSGGLRVRYTGSLTAQRAGEAWSGTFSIMREFFRKGRKFDTCRADNVTFTVQ